VSLTDGSGDATATWRVSQKDATTSWVNVSWAGAEPDRNLTVATDATAVAL
jgi:hypothetical protein